VRQSAHPADNWAKDPIRKEARRAHPHHDQFGLFRLAEISVKPNPNGLPGTPALEKLVNGLAVLRRR